eukprot:c7383_g1_i1.p1 GENE.c7383_g1_i1~~c7383_g1_i1.p1  ORF type:complete len:156 (-),score=39.05 c7383_g1_i1:65-532(-)
MFFLSFFVCVLSVSLIKFIRSSLLKNRELEHLRKELEKKQKNAPVCSIDNFVEYAKAQREISALNQKIEESAPKHNAIAGKISRKLTIAEICLFVILTWFFSSSVFTAHVPIHSDAMWPLSHYFLVGSYENGLQTSQVVVGSWCGSLYLILRFIF